MPITGIQAFYNGRARKCWPKGEKDRGGSRHNRRTPKTTVCKKAAKAVLPVEVKGEFPKRKGSERSHRSIGRGVR
jgi:hypothetical protein